MTEYKIGEEFLVGREWYRTIKWNKKQCDSCDIRPDRCCNTICWELLCTTVQRLDKTPVIFVLIDTEEE